MNKTEFAQAHNDMKRLFSEKRDSFPSHTEEQLLQLIAYQKKMKISDIRRLFVGK